MGSLIEGYNYDVFISYRQKDNKGEKWVTEFVESLKTEFESTYKDEISVYFDVNPHDGLHDTYDVDASLREKLKCLVFIPIISRIYCDPKSFAWEHEFKYFVEAASNDEFGLKINLHSGNVAGRVLPVRIHELDANDQALCEEVLGGPMRSVDFIFKSPGVNRPLRTNEETPQENLNKTYYRNQINKAAIAVEEIIDRLRQLHRGDIISSEPDRKENPEDEQRINVPEKGKRLTLRLVKGSSRVYFLIVSLLILAVAGYFISDLTGVFTPSRKLTINPLSIKEGDSALLKNRDNLYDLIKLKLLNVENIQLVDPASAQSFDDIHSSARPTGKELRRSYLLNIRLDSVSRNEFIIDLLKRDNTSLMHIKCPSDGSRNMKASNDIFEGVVSSLKVRLSKEELIRIMNIPTTSGSAYGKYLAANDIWLKARQGVSENDFLIQARWDSAVKFYTQAVTEDPLFALAYAKRSIARSFGISMGHFSPSYAELSLKDIDKALEIDRNLIEAQIAYGFYYYYCKENYTRALKHFRRASIMDPDNYEPFFYMAMVYRRMGNWEKSLQMIKRACDFTITDPLHLTNIGSSYHRLHLYKDAIKYQLMAISALPDWPVPYKNLFDAYILETGDTSQARAVLLNGKQKTNGDFTELAIKLLLYENKIAEARSLVQEWILKADPNQGTKYLYAARISGIMGDTANVKNYGELAFKEFREALLRNPSDATTHSNLGLAEALRGNRERAVEEGRNALTLVQNNKLDEDDLKVNLAQIYTIAGDYDNALKLLGEMVNPPSSFSVYLLKLDPQWGPLRNMPGYKRITD